jgi:hypothetical protein
MNNISLRCIELLYMFPFFTTRYACFLVDDMWNVMLILIEHNSIYSEIKEYIL